MIYFRCTALCCMIITNDPWWYVYFGTFCFCSHPLTAESDTSVWNQYDNLTACSLSDFIHWKKMMDEMYLKLAVLFPFAKSGMLWGLINETSYLVLRNWDGTGEIAWERPWSSDVCCCGAAFNGALRREAAGLFRLIEQQQLFSWTPQLLMYLSKVTSSQNDKTGLSAALSPGVCSAQNTFQCRSAVISVEHWLSVCCWNL